MNDHKGARLTLPAAPPATALITDSCYDSDRFRTALQHRGIQPCMPPRKNRKEQHSYNAVLYRQRHHVKNMPGKLKF